MARQMNKIDRDNPQGYSRVLMIPDLHSGSQVAIKHPDFIRGSEGTRVRIPNNPLQDIYFAEWKEMCKRVGEIDLLVLMGDMVDGTNDRGEGVGTWSTNMDEQIENAEMLLKMINFKQCLSIEGSGYHIKKNKSADQLVQEGIAPNGKFFSDIESRNGGRELKSEMDARVTVEDLVFNFRHWLNTTKSTFMYRPTKIAREMLKLRSKYKTMGTCDFVVRAHVHTYTYLDISDDLIGLTLPCWKGRDEFVRRTTSDTADNGWVMFEIDGNRFQPHFRRIDIPIKYNIPEFVFKKERSPYAKKPEVQRRRDL